MTLRLAVPIAIVSLAAVHGYAQTRDELFDRCRNFRGNPDLSIGACTALIQSGTESDGSLSAAFTNRGTSRAVLGDYDRALMDFAAAEKLNPANTTALFNRGLVYIYMGRLDDAAREADKALQIARGDPRPYLIHAESSRRRGHFRAAASEFERGLAMPLANPVQEEFFKDRQTSNQQALGCDGAVPAAAAAAAISACTAVIADETLVPGAVTRAFQQRGHAHFSRDDLAAAVADYGEAIRRDNANSGLLGNRAEALMGLGRLDEAQRDIERALALAPGDYDVTNLQGLLAHQRRDFPAAIQRFTEAEARIPAGYSPGLSALIRATFRANRGIAYLVMGQLQDARRDLDAAIGFNPTEAPALYARAVLRTRMGDTGGAGADFSAAASARANIDTLMARRFVTRQGSAPSRGK